MTDDREECFTKLFDGCTCEPGQCESFAAQQQRKRDLGTFRKERPAPVVGPTTRDTIVLAIAIGGFIGSAWGATHLNEHYKRQALIDRENVYVQR